jgi:hypothetical protein
MSFASAVWNLYVYKARVYPGFRTLEGEQGAIRYFQSLLSVTSLLVQNQRCKSTRHCSSYTWFTPPTPPKSRFFSPHFNAIFKTIKLLDLLSLQCIVAIPLLLITSSSLQVSLSIKYRYSIRIIRLTSFHSSYKTSFISLIKVGIVSNFVISFFVYC